LLLAYKLNCVNEMSIIVSLIEELKGTVLDVFQLDFLVGEKNNTYLLNKFINGVIQNNKFSNKFGDLIGFINLFTKYKAIKREDIKDFCYEYFLKCETMRRVNEHNFKLKRKLYDLLKNNHFFDDKVNNKFRESSLNTKIIAAFTYGYMFNIGIFEKGYVNNDKIRNISINKLSFFNKTDKKKGVVVYQNVLNINGDFNCNMLTYVPKKSMEIIDNVLPDLKTKSNS